MTAILCRAVALKSLALLGLSVVANAQYTFFPNDAAIKYTESRQGVVGYGNFHDYAYHENGSSPTVSVEDGADVSGGLSAWNNSVINLEGGYVDNIVTFDSSAVNITGGRIFNNLTTASSGATHISGGVIFYVVSEHGPISISGGSITSSVQAHYGSVVTISGGSIGHDVDAVNDSVINISGGSLPTYLIANDASAINLFGFGLSETLLNPDSDGFSLYALAGSLADGSSVTGTTLYVRNGTGASFSFHSAAVPEPDSIALLAGIATVGAGVLRKRRK